MKQTIPTIVYWSVLLCFLSINCFSQSHELPEPQMSAVPPPPGLVVPIDSNMSFLTTAGILLGIYVLKPKNNKE